MRTILSINQDWFYKPDFSLDEDISNGMNWVDFQQICLPHTNVELPYNYFDDKTFCFVSCYKRDLKLDAGFDGKRLFLDFEGVMNYAKVYINGTFLGEHKGGYTAFSFEITEHVNLLKNNEITVVVDSTERPDTPPFGGQIDYLTYGGIYRDVQLRVVSPTFIESVFITSQDVLAELKKLVSEIRINNLKTERVEDYAVEVVLLEDTRIISSVKKQLSQHQMTIQMDGLSDIRLWSLEEPKLYQVRCILYQGEDAIDSSEVRFGFRDVDFNAKGFYLNGEKVKLAGLNRHQSYPYVGYAMPARMQKKDADILKYTLGLNTVRTSHYPQSRHFLDRCDEIGLLVFEEIPGWQHIGDEEWQKHVLLDVEQMIIHDRNHPSIFMWGVRINESQDHHELYTLTNALAKKLDATRPIGGVRCISNSEFLEDVYTMNDFIHGYEEGDVMKPLREQREVTGLDRDVPYIVTEYNGHMYPTKRFDQEERIVEHALRHTRVQNAMQGNDLIGGAIGWCAFDYNTHSDFGSGDKICYHGVMDMFRIPKFASYAYSSQQSPKQKIVLEPATYWSYGERSIGGVIPLIIFTNCDEVKFFYGSKLKGTFTPDRAQYESMEHPPIIIKETLGDWGLHWEDATFIGYLDGQEVIRREYARNPIPTNFILEPDDLNLKAGDWDGTRIVVSVLDQFNNPLPYFNEVVNISVDGVGAIIGPSQISLIGGKIAFFIKTTGVIGEIGLAVSCPRLNKTEKITIQVEA